ncbi:MAG: GtrA family protein [Oscillospiraceae bacterium]|nr:GtrA family protein [Oscillospiraceae bacterium]
MSEPAKLTAKENLVTGVKFLLFSISAGLIQELSFILLTQLRTFAFMENPYWPRYIISLALSVIWNFTFNRRFTFKSATNVPIAMLKVLAYYVVFTPLSAWWGDALTLNRPDWVHYVVQFGTMLVNLVTEFLYQRFFVFGKSMNTNELAKKEKSSEL